MEVIVKLDEAQLSEITDVCNAAIAQCEKYERDSETLRALRNLIGYIECGEGSAVTISQDDGTREWYLRIDGESYHGDTFRGVINDTDAKYRENPDYVMCE